MTNTTKPSNQTLPVLTNNHPECREDEVFLGNFTPEQARNISWSTKRHGVRAYCADGSDFPYQHHHGVLPYFVKRSELATAGVLAMTTPATTATSTTHKSKLAEVLCRYETLRESNPYAYFELACTRHTEWMVWICTHPERSNPGYRVIANGQGDSPESAAENALKKLSENES